LHIYLQAADNTVSEPASLESISMSDCACLWIDIEEPGDAPVQLAGQDFRVDLPDLESFRKGSDIPRIQQRPNDILIVWSFPHRFSEESDKLDKSPILIIFADKLLVTVHPHLEEMAQIGDDFKGGDYENPLYSIMDATALADLELSIEVTRDIDDYLDNIMDGGRKAAGRKKKDRGDIDQIKRLKRRNVEIRKLVAAHRNVLLRLTRRGARFVSEDLARDLMDIVEQVWRIDDEVQNNSDLITASLDIQLNVTMKRLTTIATIFMPLTFVVGLYGMNFRNMPELTWRFGYLFAWTTIIVVAVAMTIIARKKGWF
jgi:magnesium transporter